MTVEPTAGAERLHVYTGSSTNWPMVVGSILLALPLAFLGITGSGGWEVLVLPIVVPVGAALLNVLTASSVRATAGPQGVTVHWGLVGWPRMHYRRDEIVSAEVVRVRWFNVTYGLWWTPWRTTCTVHTGPALRLQLASGRLVTITVPEPDEAVAALSA